MTILTEGKRTAEFIVSEANGYRSREEVTVDATGGALSAGAVLGKVTTAGAASVADGSNTGDGVLTVDVTDPVLSGASVGAYLVTVTEAATNGGQYTVTDPNGNVIGVANVGDTFATEIKFVLADGAADFVVGDFFTITVSAGDGDYVAYDESATDGSEIVAGILYEGSTGAVSEARTVFVRDGEVKTASLVYTGTAGLVTAGLAALGIIARA